MPSGVMYGHGKDKSYQPAADRLHFLQIPCQLQHSVSISYRAAAPCGAVFFVHHSDPRLPDSAASPFSVFSGLASGQTVSGTEEIGCGRKCGRCPQPGNDF